jgi:hypothetical protein
MPISKYRSVQAGANNQFGGVKDGFSSVAYHVGIASLVNIEPMIPAHRQATTHTISFKMSLSFMSRIIPLKDSVISINAS